MPKEIKLTRGLIAVVDEADFESLSAFKWNACPCGPNFYARRNTRINGKHGSVYMHRQIMSAPRGVEVDHVNHNSLDNRRDNLRLATRAQNSANVSRLAKNSSGFKGVHWNEEKRAWCATITHNKKRVFLGLFKDKQDAAKAYDEAALVYHGAFASTNGTMEPRV